MSVHYALFETLTHFKFARLLQELYTGGKPAPQPLINSTLHSSDPLEPLFFFLSIRPPPKSPLFPYPTLFRSSEASKWGKRRRDSCSRGFGRMPRASFFTERWSSADTPSL